MTDCEAPTRAPICDWVQPREARSRISEGQSIGGIIGVPMQKVNRPADIVCEATGARGDKSHEVRPAPRKTSLGIKVRTLRKIRGFTQAQLAKRLKITQPSLSEIETGETKEVSGVVLAGLCRELRAMPDYFVLDEEGDTDFGELGLAQQEAGFLLGHMKGETREAALRSLRGMAGAPLADQFNGQKPKTPADATQAQKAREGRSKRAFALGVRTTAKKVKREA